MAGTKWWLLVLVAMSLRAFAVRADGEDDGGDEAPGEGGANGETDPGMEVEVGSDEDGGGGDDHDDHDEDSEVGQGRALINNADPCSRNPCPIGTHCRSTFGTGYTCDPIHHDPCSPNPCPQGSVCKRNALAGGYLCEAVHIDPCAPNPCPPGTVCKRDAFGSGFTCGAVRADPCSPNPCPFGQRCERAGAWYHCLPPPADVCRPDPCPVGQVCKRLGDWYRCVPTSVPVGPCIPNPCPIGQRCIVNGAAGYQCVAPPTPSPCAGNPCLNGGQCRVVSGTRYVCVCLPLFTGSHCEIVLPSIQGACSPNPCDNGCQCVQSCRHSSGYFCKNNNGYLGKNCTIPPPIIRCAPDLVTVTVDDAFVREYDMTVRNSKLYTALAADSVPGQECYATFNGVAHSFSIPAPYTKCGTKTTREGNSIVVENNIWLNRFTNGQYDMPVPVICYQCRYTTEYTFMTSLTPAVDQPQILRAEGRILKQGTIELCKVGHTCPNGCPTQFAVTGGAVYTVGELIHIIIRGDNTGTLAVRSLFLSCDGHPGSASPVVSLVSNGCPATAGHRMPASVTHSGVSPVACVSFQVPRLHGCSRFFIHAQMDVCNGVPCRTPVCPPLVGRRRREVIDELDFGVGDIFGPIYIWEGGDGVPSAILFPDQSIVNTTAKILDRPGENRIEELPRRLDGYTTEPELRGEEVPNNAVTGFRPYVYVLVAVTVFVTTFVVALVLLALHRHRDATHGSKLSLFLK